jgi:hypothetical protein
MGEAARLSGVFFEPPKAFADIASRPTFWVPLILSILVGLVYSFLLGQHVGWNEVFRQGMQMNPRAAQQFDQLPADQRERAMELQARFAPVGAYGAVVVGTPVGILVIAAVLLAIVRGILSAPVGFGQMFAIVAYAGMPRIIQTILMTIVMFLKKPEEFNTLNPLAFNPGAFMDPQTSSKFVYSLASSLDLFTIWYMVLIAVGIKAAGRKVSFGGALASVIFPWLVVVLIAATIKSVLG